MADTSWLKSQGIDPKSIHGYVANGWLERVVRGVYRRPVPAGVREDPDIAWQAPLLSLQWIMNYDVHLGGESALELAGFSHYLALGHNIPRSCLWQRAVLAETPPDPHAIRRASSGAVQR